MGTPIAQRGAGLQSSPVPQHVSFFITCPKGPKATVCRLSKRATSRDGRGEDAHRWHSGYGDQAACGLWYWQELRAVRRFLEKPDVARATEAMATGGLWNTLVLAAKVDTLWTLGWRCFPEMMPLFEALRGRIGSTDEHVLLDEIYCSMPARNFSSGLLERVPQHVAVIEANGVVWSDWGNAERIADTLLRLGKKPAFPLDLITAPITVGT